MVAEAIRGTACSAGTAQAVAVAHRQYDHTPAVRQQRSRIKTFNGIPRQIVHATQVAKLQPAAMQFGRLARELGLGNAYASKPSRRACLMSLISVHWQTTRVIRSGPAGLLSFQAPAAVCPSQ